MDVKVGSSRICVFLSPFSSITGREGQTYFRQEVFEVTVVPKI